jgi:hypothetical protein
MLGEVDLRWPGAALSRRELAEGTGPGSPTSTTSPPYYPTLLRIGAGHPPESHFRAPQDERHASQAAGHDSAPPGCPGAGGETSRGPSAADRGLDHRVRRVDAVRLSHIVVLTIWMLFIGSKPWPTLTLAVSLEAIFLSTFVMIGQNRQAKGDHDFTEQELELKTNTQLTREIDRLTIELHNRLVGKPAR